MTIQQMRDFLTRVPFNTLLGCDCTGYSATESPSPAHFARACKTALARLTAGSRRLWPMRRWHRHSAPLQRQTAEHHRRTEDQLLPAGNGGPHSGPVLTPATDRLHVVCG